MARKKQEAVLTKPLILLDRDGVLNRLVADPEQGTIDSPLHPTQVEVFPWVPEAVAMLVEGGYGLAIVTNQPAWAKGKTTHKNLLAVHEAVVNAVISKGGKILSSHICFHKAEDNCACRKPRTGLLEEAFISNHGSTKEGSWMVGDGLTDIEAGASAGVRKAFIGARKCDMCQIMMEKGLKPDFWGASLMEFTEYILGNKKGW